MSQKNHSNTAASIRQKLLNYAKKTKQDFQRVIDSYAIECILDRIVHSKYSERFVLKGALLFTIWKGLGNRPTRDIDLMGWGSNDIEEVVEIFKQIVSVNIMEDCIIFSPNLISGTRIKEEDDYQGVKLFISGSLSGAIFKVHVDVGFGDAITPAPKYADFPRMIPIRQFSILTYPPETVFAEKLDAIILRGLLNSRMKDYYDLNVMIKDNLIDNEYLKKAVENTFERRKTTVPTSCPSGLSDEFSRYPDKISQWNGFLKKSGLEAGELYEVISAIRQFVNISLKYRW